MRLIHSGYSDGSIYAVEHTDDCTAVHLDKAIAELPALPACPTAHRVLSEVKVDVIRFSFGDLGAYGDEEDQDVRCHFCGAEAELIESDALIANVRPGPNYPR